MHSVCSNRLTYHDVTGLRSTRQTTCACCYCRTQRHKVSRMSSLAKHSPALQQLLQPAAHRGVNQEGEHCVHRDHLTLSALASHACSTTAMLMYLSAVHTAGQERPCLSHHTVSGRVCVSSPLPPLLTPPAANLPHPVLTASLCNMLQQNCGNIRCGNACRWHQSWQC